MLKKIKKEYEKYKALWLYSMETMFFCVEHIRRCPVNQYRMQQKVGDVVLDVPQIVGKKIWKLHVHIPNCRITLDVWFSDGLLKMTNESPATWLSF